MRFTLQKEQKVTVKFWKLRNLKSGSFKKLLNIHSQSFLSRTAIAVAIFLSLSSSATSYGPTLPTHHYPTDKSFHLAYNFSRIRSSKDYVGSGTTQFNDSNSTFRLFRHEFIPEFQPNRKLSFGAKLNIDAAQLSTASGFQINQSSLSDQFFFLEFRAHDSVGSSVGLATVIKFPGYSNPTLSELQATDDPNNVILIGDAQIDITAMITTENWFKNFWRLQGDLGYTYRADGFAPQAPFMFSIAYVTPKMDFSLRAKGNLSLGEGIATSSEVQTLRDAFANSDWALSPNPWVLILEPAIELWISSRWAINIQYSYTLMGNNAPSYTRFASGLTYRWSETNSRKRKKFKEVPIWMDQEAGKFSGESEDDESNSGLGDEDPVFEEREN